MADKSIGELPVAQQLDDDSLLVVEQQGEARSIQGVLVKGFAQASVSQYVDSAKASAEAAEKSAADAADSLAQIGTAVEDARGYAQEAGTSAETAEQSATQALAAAGTATEQAAAASDSATAAKESETAAQNSAESADASQKAAQDAQTGAETARDEAVTAGTTATEKAAEAVQSAADAEKSRQAIENMTVSAETLEPGADATVTKTEDGGVVHLQFGLPKGEKGDKGDPGRDGTGTGDMEKAVYDTKGVGQDIYEYVDNAVANVQPELTFDDVPTANSSNPVKSGGIYDALEGKAELGEDGKVDPAQLPEHLLAAEDGEAPEVEFSLDADTLGGHAADYFAVKGDVDTALEEKANASDLEAKQDKLTGTAGQVVGFDESGNPVAQDAPSGGGITQEQADARYLKLEGGTMAGPLSVQEPTESTHAATKGYVDGLVGDIGTILDEINGEAG